MNLLEEKLNSVGGIFKERHLGPRQNDVNKIVKKLEYSALDDLMDAAIPESIRLRKKLEIPAALTELQALESLKEKAKKNQIYKSYLGLGYYGTVTPPVILRNILENPGWYTAYTPYQSEISQGRLEALLNYQTMISDLTGLEMANGSLLDEGTAAAEAMAMANALYRGKDKSERGFFVSKGCFPQTVEVIKTRAEALGVSLIIGDHREFDFSQAVFGVLVQYPDEQGSVQNYEEFFKNAHAHGAMTVVAADLLSLTLFRSPGDFGADIAVGSSQRFGVPMGYGGPHAAYFATREAFKRNIPGRIVGVSKDRLGNQAIRLALQTREQHIRREKATSNICTAQVLLAVIASMYAVYHGPKGLREISERIHSLTLLLAEALKRAGFSVGLEMVFDTLKIAVEEKDVSGILKRAEEEKINLRKIDKTQMGVSIDETTTLEDLSVLLKVFTGKVAEARSLLENAKDVNFEIPAEFKREVDYLKHDVFHRYHSETEMLRYLKRLENKDVSLTHSMIALGSCTMKLNATSEMLPVTWPEFSNLHPFVPLAQAQGYLELFKELEEDLAEITGFDVTSLQPNAGSQGEYAGLLLIKKYHEDLGEAHRDICLIPSSAHGTNPASAVMAGLKVVTVACDTQGNIDVEDLKSKIQLHAQNLSSLMITYPSTHGVFETKVKEICELVHASGGQVYMDGANLNAQIGLCRPGDYGADVSHLNLHKTFCIPHGGGGPGMGPICAKKHLAPYLPKHPLVETGGEKGIGSVSAAPWGSASILPISWAYIRMMGEEGLKRSSEVAILSANYIAKRLESSYPILYRGANNLVAHECIVDLRGIESKSGVTVEDVAKRLADYGFHSPTMSWPVAGTLMIEPTESESLEEMDRFCEAMISIRQEIEDIIQGKADRANNVLKNAPHPASEIARSDWDHPYSREQAAYPVEWLKDRKYWPPISRVDNPWGDRNFCCTI
jgi:glycine dehydrogenase